MEWEVTNNEEYTCTVNLTKNGPTCSCNLSQQQKMSHAHIIATCINNKIVPT